MCFGVGVHLTPTFKRRKGDSDYRAQRHYRVCKIGRTTLVCSSYRDGTGGDLLFCGPNIGAVRNSVRFHAQGV